MTNDSRRRFSWSPVFEMLRRFAGIITVLGIAAFGFFGAHFLSPHEDPADAEAIESAAQTAAESNGVSLTPEKLAAAGLATLIIQPGTFQAHKAIPGIVTYDATKKIVMWATVDCLVKKTLVSANQFVNLGDPVLLLTGPEIGSAKSEVCQCDSAVELLDNEYLWTKETHANIEALMGFLAQAPTSEQIKTRFDDRNLGEYRDEILTAYAELLLARRLAERVNDLKAEGVISGKTAEERKSRLDVALAKFNSIREVLTFQTSQTLTRAKAKLDAEKKRLAVCQERLSAFLGPAAEGSDVWQTTVLGDGQTRSFQHEPMGDSDFVLRAPRSGQVVALQAVESARFARGEVLAEIADTSDVWIEAQISQRDWHSLNLEAGQQLTVRVPGVPDQSFVAALKHISATVSKDTLAIPLVAELPNEKNQFRPGMSVWVDIPISRNRKAIVVPEGALQRHDNANFVFLKTGERAFEKRTVISGEESEGQIEILSGLMQYDEIVVQGAFFLKSELLLAEEDE